MISFRLYNNEDMDECLKIYSDNVASEYIPPQSEYLYEFIETLKSPDVLSIVAAMNSKVIAVGNVNYMGVQQAAFLSFGLVAPKYHKQKIGSLMLALRISLLETTPPYPMFIYMCATKNSVKFYQKVFGFKEESEEIDEYGNVFYDLELLATDGVVNLAKKLANKVNFSTDGIKVPICELDEID